MIICYNVCMNEIRNGILLVNKPMNMTSFDVIAKLRKSLWTRQLGHTGTLDPNATGLLVVLVNKATKILPFLTYERKTYRCTMKLGIQTRTGDIWSETLVSMPVPALNQEDILQVFESFIGEHQQIPPMVSAIKVNGKKLYEYERENIEVERKPRDITIFDLRLLSFDEDTITYEVDCSAGTYVRTLCEDMAKKMNTVGTMSALHRICSGNFDVKDAVSIEDVINGNYKIIPTIEALQHYPYIEYESLKDIFAGKKIELDSIYDEVLIGKDREAYAIYKREKDNIYRCVRGLW